MLFYQKTQSIFSQNLEPHVEGRFPTSVILARDCACLHSFHSQHPSIAGSCWVPWSPVLKLVPIFYNYDVPHFKKVFLSIIITNKHDERDIHLFPSTVENKYDA